MADKIFTIDNPFNPIRFVLPDPFRDPAIYFYPSRRNTLSYELIPDFQYKKCYHQKYTLSDSPVIQILSDYDDIFIAIHNSEGYQVKEIPVVLKQVSILEQTFKCYEATFDFSDLEEGVYQIQASYVNDAQQNVTYYSEPIELKEIHEDTIRIEYKNSENNFDLIFETDFVGILRVEGAILNFKPASDDVIYNDQDRNSTTVYSLPYDIYQLFIGGKEGVPDWLVSKVNRSFSFDILSLDGEYYNKVEGAKFEETRAPDYPFSGQSIEIMPVDNGFLRKIKVTDLIPDEEQMIQYDKLLKYLSNSANIEIQDIFKNGTILNRITIINRGIDFDLTIRTGDEDGPDDVYKIVRVEGRTFSVTIDQPFDTNKTLYLEGLNGIDTDVYVEWTNLNATPTTGTGSIGGVIPIGFVGYYSEPEPGDIDLHWNFGTGLGRAETPWEGWAIMDGRNGTEDWGGVFPIGFKEATGGLFTKALLGTKAGTWLINLAVNNLPKFRVRLFAATRNGSANDDPTGVSSVAYAGDNGLSYQTRRSTANATLGVSSEVGGDTAYDHKSPYIVTLPVKKIA